MVGAKQIQKIIEMVIIKVRYCQRNSRKRIVLKCSPLFGNIYFHIKITIKIIVLIDDINFISLDIFNM